MTEKTETTTERPDRQGLQHIYSRAKEKRENTAAAGDEPVSPITKRAAEIMEAEARGEEVDPEMYSMGTEGIDEEAPTPKDIEAAQAEAAGEEAEEQTEEQAPEEDEVEIEAQSDDNEEDGAEESSATVEVRVNGKTYHVPEKEVSDQGGVEAYQMRRAAAQNLQASVDVLRKAHQKAAELAKTATPSKPDGATPSSDVSAEATEEREAWMDALYDGDIEKAKKLWNQAQTQRQDDGEPSVAPETAELEKPAELVEAENRLAAERKRQIAEANELAERKFGDLLKDKTLKNIMYQRYQAIAADPANQGREFKYMVEEAGNWLRQFQRNQKSNGSAETQAAIEQRTVKKRSLPTDSAASEKRRSPKPQEKKPMSRQDYMKLRLQASGRLPRA